MNLLCILLYDTTFVEVILRMVPTFATVHTYCVSRDGPRKLGFLTAVPAQTKIFLRGL